MNYFGIPRNEEWERRRGKENRGGGGKSSREKGKETAGGSRSGRTGKHYRRLEKQDRSRTRIENKRGRGGIGRKKTKGVRLGKVLGKVEREFVFDLLLGSVGEVETRFSL